MRIKWNRQALYDVRRDPAVVALLDATAQDIADRANSMGNGTYAVGSQQGVRRPQGRWRASVVTADAKAMAENAKRNILIRALD